MLPELPVQYPSQPVHTALTFRKANTSTANITCTQTGVWLHHIGPGRAVNRQKAQQVSADPMFD